MDPAKTTGGALDNPALMRSTLVAQQLLQKVAETLAGLAGESDATAVRAMYTAVADAFAATLVSGDPLANNGELDEDVIAGIVADAADRAQALYTFTSPVNSETLGIVMAGALAIQAETILAASEDDLATVTAEAQTNGQIESFIVTNVGLLNVEPGTAAAALSTLLLAQLNPYLALVDDEIRLVNGSSETAYAFEEFQSTAGVSLAWPLPEPMMMELSISDPAAYTPVSGQVISAAVSITETGGGQGKLLAYITRQGSAYRLMTQDLESGTTQALSDTNDDESPSFAPNGRLLVYATRQQGSDVLMTTTLDGKIKTRLLSSGADMREPAWGPYGR